MRRTDYDHEDAYRRIAAAGGRGWDDLTPDVDQGSYRALDGFLATLDRRGRALELGCGGGQAALRLARLGWHVHGVDYSETAIELARRNARDEGLAATFTVADATALDLEPGTWDLVLDNHALHCLVTPELRAAFLASARRALAPSGRLWSETMSCEGDWSAERCAVAPATNVSRNRTRIWVSRERLRGELAAAGLRLLREELRPGDPGTGDTIVTVCDAAP